MSFNLPNWERKLSQKEPNDSNYTWNEMCLWFISVTACMIVLYSPDFFIALSDSMCVCVCLWLTGGPAGPGGPLLSWVQVQALGKAGQSTSFLWMITAWWEWHHPKNKNNKWHWKRMKCDRTKQTKCECDLLIPVNVTFHSLLSLSSVFMVTVKVFFS